MKSSPQLSHLVDRVKIDAAIITSDKAKANFDQRIKSIILSAFRI
ncbi:Uncharacterised protein [Vibrio cholerae]|nr:Uncharacterised protein [Vibrio cholerae]